MRVGGACVEMMVGDEYGEMILVGSGHEVRVGDECV